MQQAAILELGELQAPVLVFGGPYSNLQATRAMRSLADAQGIAPRQTICTGDIVAYCASPSETVAELRDWGCHSIMGNCEESLGNAADDCGCGFDEGTACSLLSVQWYQFANKRVNAEDRGWMRALPRFIRFSINGCRCLVVHGAVSSINRFIFPSNAAEMVHEEFATQAVDCIIAGHSGIPFTFGYREDNGRAKVWHNAGVIGMPANDGTGQVWYSIIRPGRQFGHLDFAHMPLAYNAELARQIMLASGLNNGYADALTSGLWPSMDVLPEVERVKRGIALQAEQYAFAPVYSRSNPVSG